MGRCAICAQNKTLTRAHIFPDALIEKIFGKKVMVYTTEQGYRAGSVPVVKDECTDCQQKSARVFDDRVSRIVKILEALKTIRPTTIEVNEPWFTLYMLRIFWASHRGEPLDQTPPEVVDCVRNSILAGKEIGLSAASHERVKIFFCQEPSVISYRGTRVPVDKLFESGGREITNGLSIYEGYLRLGRLKMHIFTVHEDLIRNPTILQFWEAVEKELKKSASKWESIGVQRYEFTNFCARTTSSENQRGYISHMSSEAKHRTKTKYRK